MEPSAWNSLEITKLMLSALTPIIGGYIAWKLAKIGSSINSQLWRNQKVIEKRLVFYEIVIPDLNDLYCFYNYVGNWKELTPPEIISKKRKLDKSFHIYSHLFNGSIVDYYNDLISKCFLTYTGWGQDTKILSDIKQRKVLENWEENWAENFELNKITNRDELKNSYKCLISSIRNELGILE